MAAPLPAGQNHIIVEAFAQRNGARAVATSNTEGLHNRLDAMYVDKLDGRIENAFFDRIGGILAE
jgi:hypothetical protein